MVKTSVKKHPRKGTKGVKKHSRTVPTRLEVPHNVADPLIFSGNIEEYGDFTTYITYNDVVVNNLILHDLTPKEMKKDSFSKSIEIYEIQLPKKTVFLARHKNLWTPPMMGFAQDSGKTKPFSTFKEARSFLRKESKIKVKDMDFKTQITPNQSPETFRSLCCGLGFKPIN